MKYTNISGELTIVIPCYNEVNYIGKTLMNIGKQVGIKGTRVIVCDGKSTDGTQKVIKRFKEELKDVLNIEIQIGGKVARGRNVGANLCETPYILFLDAFSRSIDKNSTSLIAASTFKVFGNRMLLGTTWSINSSKLVTPMVASMAFKSLCLGPM